MTILDTLPGFGGLVDRQIFQEKQLTLKNCIHLGHP